MIFIVVVIAVVVNAIVCAFYSTHDFNLPSRKNSLNVSVGRSVCVDVCVSSH